MLESVLRLIQPKEITIDGKQLAISKFPALAGIEIASQFPAGISALASDAMNLLVSKVMNYVAIKNDSGNYVLLNSKDLINNHLITEYPLETLTKIVIEVMEYNFSFLEPGSLLGLLRGSFQIYQQLSAKISTASSELSSLTEKQR